MADINMGMSEALRAEMANITSTQRAAVGARYARRRS